MGIGFVALLPFGAGEWSSNAPALSLLAIGASMTIPMVPWMRWRGHGSAACDETAAAMIVPTLASVVLLAAGIVTDIGTLMAIEHTAMFTPMFVTMLLRYGSTCTTNVPPASSASLPGAAGSGEGWRVLSARGGNQLCRLAAA